MCIMQRITRNSITEEKGLNELLLLSTYFANSYLLIYGVECMENEMINCYEKIKTEE